MLDVLKDGVSMGRLELGLRVPSQRCLVGRHPECDLMLEHLSVSRHHAELTLDHAGHLFLTDLGAGEEPPRRLLLKPPLGFGLALSPKP